MAERWTVDPVVAGSTPVSHPAVVSGQEGLTTDHFSARVAQRIERRTSNPSVASSNLASGTTKTPAIQQAFLLLRLPDLIRRSTQVFLRHSITIQQRQN